MRIILLVQQPPRKSPYSIFTKHVEMLILLANCFLLQNELCNNRYLGNCIKTNTLCR